MRQVIYPIYSTLFALYQIYATNKIKINISCLLNIGNRNNQELKSPEIAGFKNLLCPPMSWRPIKSNGATEQDLGDVLKPMLEPKLDA